MFFQQCLGNTRQRSSTNQYTAAPGIEHQSISGHHGNITQQKIARRSFNSADGNASLTTLVWEPSPWLKLPPEILGQIRQHNSPLLELPTEIRRLILRYTVPHQPILMLQPTHMLYLHRNQGWVTRNFKPSASIFLVNRQICYEARDAFYRYADPNITLAPASLNKILPGIVGFRDFDLVLANFLRYIRNLDINLDWEDDVVGKGVWTSMVYYDRHFNALRNMPTLRTITLHWRMYLKKPHRLVINARPNCVTSFAILWPFVRLQDHCRHMKILVQRAHHPYILVRRKRRFWEPPALPMQRYWYEEWDEYEPLRTLVTEMVSKIRQWGVRVAYS